MAATPKSKLPQVNQCTKRTKLRPREVLSVAYTSGTGRTLRVPNDGTYTSGAAIPAATITKFGQFLTQLLIDNGDLNVAP